MDSRVRVVLDFAQCRLLQGYGVIQSRSSVACQVFAIAVTAEDEGLGHKHAVAFAGVGHHLSYPHQLHKKVPALTKDHWTMWLMIPFEADPNL